MRLVALFSTVLITLLTLGNADIAHWCAKTPFPAPCNHLPQPPKDHHDFYNLLLQLTLTLAIRAQSHLKPLGSLCRDEPQRAAWLDCRKLYGNTVKQLNRTLRESVTAVEAQTWLSAALTNTHTCHKGFAALNTSSKLIQPILRYNVSDLITNCLAVNNSSSNATVASINRPIALENHLLAQLRSQRADMVVAQDGSGSYRSIKAAIDAANGRRLKGFSRRIVIYVKAGVYNEIITVKSSLYDLTLVGDGIGKTVITGSRSVAGGYTTFSSATFSVFGDGFIGRGLTFRNTFGPGSQAVALMSGSDRSVFYRCGIEGYQDTLCVYTQRQFYRECDIYGTIDFIFGNAAVVIQKSRIFLRKPLLGESNVITAQGRTDPLQNTGIVIQSSSIRAGPDLRAAGRRVRSYLGRPWQLRSRTLYLQNYMEGVIDPAGWMEFNGRFALDTLYFGEYRNTGPGSRALRRVNWKGVHVLRSASQVSQFTAGNFIGGETWIPQTGVPFDLGF